MMNLFHDIEPGKPNKFNLVIENTKGSTNKVEYDKEKGVFKLDRVLFSPVFWPFEYGFIPRTWYDDEDPIDVVLLTTYPTFPGCLIEARPIGILIMEDEKGLDTKIIAVPVEDPRFNEIEDIKDLDEHKLKEIKEFFETYKRLEPGKFVRVKGWEGRKKAEKEIERAIEAYKKKFGEKNV